MELINLHIKICFVAGKHVSKERLSDLMSAARKQFKIINILHMCAWRHLLFKNQEEEEEVMFGG